MAEKAKNGNYVKLGVNVWYDKRNNNVHLTSNDKDLPNTHMHMTAKKSTQSDKNLRALLDHFGCGPKNWLEGAAKAKGLTPELADVEEDVEYLIDMAQTVGHNGDAAELLYQGLTELKAKIEGMAK